MKIRFVVGFVYQEFCFDHIKLECFLRIQTVLDIEVWNSGEIMGQDIGIWKLLAYRTCIGFLVVFMIR